MTIVPEINEDAQTAVESSWEDPKKVENERNSVVKRKTKWTKDEN